MALFTRAIDQSRARALCIAVIILWYFSVRQCAAYISERSSALAILRAGAAKLRRSLCPWQGEAADFRTRPKQTGAGIAQAVIGQTSASFQPPPVCCTMDNGNGWAGQGGQLLNSEYGASP